MSLTKKRSGPWLKARSTRLTVCRADHTKIVSHLGDVLQLTEKFRFESGTQNGVNWHNGVPFAPGTYRVKSGRTVVWDGKVVSRSPGGGGGLSAQWKDKLTGLEVDPF